MAQGICTIDEIVRETCFEMDDNGMHHYQKFLMWALEGVQDMNMDTVSTVKSVVLRTNSIATIPFPNDFVNWVKVGAKVGDRVKVLTINDRLSTHHSLDSSGNEVNNDVYQPDYSSGDFGGEAGIAGYWFWNVYYDGSLGGNIFGYGNGTQGEGEFTLDRDNRRFQFASDLTDCDILIEYISNGLSSTGATMVEEIARKAIKLYVIWKHSERTRSYGLQEKERARHEYYNERRMVGRRSASLTPEDIIAVVRSSYMQTPKT